MAKKLTPKEAKLVRGIAEGKTKTQAYIDAYDTKGHLPTVEAEASKTTSKPHVKQAIEEAMEKLNLTPERALKPIDDALNSDDLEMRLKGSDRAIRLMTPKGDNNININFNQIVKDQRDRYGD